MAFHPSDAVCRFWASWVGIKGGKKLELGIFSYGVQCDAGFLYGVVQIGGVPDGGIVGHDGTPLGVSAVRLAMLVLLLVYPSLTTIHSFRL